MQEEYRKMKVNLPCSKILCFSPTLTVTTINSSLGLLRKVFKKIFISNF